MIGSKMPSFAIFILTSLLVFTEAGPVNKIRGLNTCAEQCSGTNKFGYQPGTVYEFSYDAKTTTKMNGASEDSATINMNAMVEIEPLTKCDLVMRIKDASLRDSEDDQNSQAFKEAMMKQTLKFSFQDGKIDHICSMDVESTWTLNIKRGILSAFQNSMDSFDRNQNLTETDVVGSCVSEYKVSNENQKTIVFTKTKNLLGCTEREGYHMAIQSIGYNVPSFVKSLPLMKSEYKCTQTLDLSSNILQSSTCSDEHVFRPFSYGKNGAMTSSKQTLTFINKRSTERVSDGPFGQRTTLLFHHEHDMVSKQEKEDNIEAKLQELCQKASEDIRPEVPELVNQLIEHMRQVDRDVLSGIYMKINQKTICAHRTDRIKQYFHDAIPMVGTAASVGMIQELISKKHITGSEAEMWLLSLSFVHHPTKEMVAAAKPLLDERDVSGNTLLAVSSLTSSYCNVQPECGRDSEVSDLIGKLMELTYDCNVQNGDARKIVFALRALGNIGHSHEAVSHLSRCFTRREVQEEIRIAAMDAFRRIPCDAVRSDLMGVFRDESEDSELRLNAYISLMKCPGQTVLSEVRQVLEKEKSNQVGSFVWSHLTNLMETSDPHMQDIRNIVQDEELKKEFNLDQRKFSRNYEGSFFLDSINTGAKVDSNVIFSEKSFIPRSANLNLTIDLFGNAINFLEFGGRVQGMERILENFFGPTGVNEPEMKSKTSTKFDKSMDALRGSAYMRVFGNELRYWDDKSLKELQSSLSELMRMQAVSFSKSMQLLDSRMVIPTCVGLPLSLTMSATGSISVDAKASLQQQKLEMNVDFKPSASVQVKGEMSVDAHLSKAGLKMVTVAHTSTGARLDIRNNKFEVQIPQKKMDFFNLKTDFYIVHRNTEKKQKMIVDNVKKHEICTGNLMKQVTGLKICQTILYPNASGHNEAPFFPFTGPVVYDLYMMNEDAPNGYVIEGFTKNLPYSFYMDTPNSKVSRRIAIDTVMNNKHEAQITFEAPWKNIKIEGTVVNMEEMKKLTGKLFLNENMEYTLNAELGMKNTKDLMSFTPKFEITIPQKKMTYEGKIEVNPMKTLMIDMSAMGFIASDINLKVSGEIIPKEIGLTTQLKIGKEVYYIAGRSGRLVTKSGFKYTPSLKITTPNGDLVEFTSEMIYESNKKMSLDFKLNNVFPKTIAMNAIVLLNAGKTKTKNILKVIFKSPRGNFRINGDVDKKKDGITSRIIGSYNFGPKYSDHLTLSSKIRDLSVKNSARYMGSIALASKKRESLNFNLKGQLAKAINHLETKFDLLYGNPKIKTNNLKFGCVINRALKQFSHTYDFTMTVQHPGQKIDYNIEVHHLQSATWPFKKFENTMMVQSASENVLKTSLSYSNGKEKGLPCYKAGASLSYPGRDMKISEKLIQLSTKSWQNSLNVQWQKGGQVSIYSTYNKTRAGIYNTETTVSLAGEKEIKFTGMMHVTPGAYKAKASLEADPGVMSNERINYMAKAGVQYKFKAKQISTDASLDVMWAEDKNLSGNFNLKYTQGVSMSSRLLLRTPTDVLKSVDTKIKWGWGKNKFSATATLSLNDKINIKQDLSYTYPNTQLSYTSSVDFMGKTSDIVIGLDVDDSSLNATMRVSHNKETKTDITVRYTSHKNDETDIQMRFTILSMSGKISMNTKFNLKKQMLELNGSAKFNLPLQQLREIGASYNLKHNQDLSSIDLSCSSSLTDYRNAKMSIKMKRNLPKMLKLTMDMSLNDRSMIKMNANYGRQGNNVSIKVDITEPSGQKMAVSGDVNFADKKKTANVAVKSKYINVSADGAFEYQGTRSAGCELKMTTDGTSVSINAGYKKEGSAYMVTGNMGLPDGRSLKMEGSLDLENNVASLKTMNPDVPELTQFEMAFSFNSDEQMLTSAVSLKAMPYFDTTEVEMKFTKKEFSIEMKTQLESFKQAMVTVMFDGDWVQSQKVKTVVQLNKENVFSLLMLYSFNNTSDFFLSFNGFTSHRRYNEFQLELKNKSPLSLKLKLADVLVLDAMIENSERTSRVSLDAQLLDFDEWKSMLILEGDLSEMKAQVITSMAKKEINRIDASFKGYGRSINVKVNGPKSVNFDFNMDIDTEAITFNMASTFTMNGREKYEMSASYEHLSKLQIKSSIPSYQNELMIIFSGKLEAFNLQTKLSFNNLNYEFILSNNAYYRQVRGILNTPYFQDTATFRFDGELSAMNVFAQVMHKKEKFELTFSNSGYYKQIDARLTTPHFQPMLKFSFIGNLEKFNFDLKVSFDKQLYEMKAFNENYYQQMNFLLDTPFLNCDFNLEGSLENTKGSFMVIYDNAKYLVYLNRGGDLNDMKASLFGKIDDEEYFKLVLSIKEYGATINVDMDALDMVDLEFTSELDMENVSFNLRSSVEFLGEEIYKIIATYEHMTKLHVKCSALFYVGELKMTLAENGNLFDASLKLPNVVMLNAMFQNSKKASRFSLDAQIWHFDEWKATFVTKGNLDSMTVRIITSVAKKEVNRIDVNLKGYGRSINVKVNGPKSVNFDFNMDLDTEAITFNMASTFTMNGREKYEMSASYEHLSKLQITASIPSYQNEMTVIFSGKAEAFNLQTKLSLNNLIYELILSNKGYYRQVRGILNTPYLQDTATFGFDGELSAMNVFAQVMHKKEKFELTFSNNGYYEQIDAQMTTPHFQPRLTFSLIGSPEKFNLDLKVNVNKQLYEMKASNEHYFRQMNFLLNTPYLNGNFEFNESGGSFNLNSHMELEGEEIYKIVATYKHLAKLYIKTSFMTYNDELIITLDGDLEMFNTLVKLTHNTTKYELIISNKGYYRKMDAQLVTPYFTDMFTFTVNGDEEAFTAHGKFMHDKDEYKLVVSNRKHFQNLIITLSTPFSSDRLDIDFEGDLSSFKSMVTFSHNKIVYRLQLSADGYYQKIDAKLTTPSIQTELLFKLEGTLQTFNSMADLTYYGKKYTFEISNKDYYKEMSMKLLTPFSDNSVSVSLDGDLNDFNAKLNFMHSGDLYELVIHNSGYYRNIKIDLKSPLFGGSVEFTLKGNLQSFNMVSKVMHNNDKYELTASNVDYYRQMKAVLTIPTNKWSAEFSLKGNLDSLNMVTKVMHNNEKYELTASNVDYYRQMKAEFTIPTNKWSAEFSLEGNLQSFNMVTKVMNNNEKYELTVSTANYYRQMKTELTTPFYKGSVEFSLKGNVQSFNMVTKVMHNNEKYELTASNANLYRQIKAKLTTPFYKGSVEFSLKGNVQSFNMATKLMHNNDKYELTASNANIYHQMKAKLTTPFYEESVEFSLKGNLQSFNMVTKVMHNNGKYELTVSTVNYYRQMKAELTTPSNKLTAEFSLKGNLQSFNMVTKVMHNSETYLLSTSTVKYYRQVKAELTTPFYKGSVESSLKGTLQSFNLVTKVMHNNDKFQLTVSTVNYYRQMKAELTTPYFKDSVNFFFKGTLRKFNTQLTLKHDKIVYEMKASNQEFYRQLKFQLNTPFLNCGLEYSIEMAKKHFIVTIQQDKYELSVYSKKSFLFNDITLSTPQHKLKISSKVYHKKKSISGVINVQLDGRVFTLTGIFKNAAPKYIFNANFKSPYFTATLQSSSMAKNRKVPADQKPSVQKYFYEMLTQNQNFYNELDFNLKKSGMKMKFSFKGNLQKCKVISSLKKATDLYELNFSNLKYFQTINMEVLTPQSGLLKFNSNYQNLPNRFELASTFSQGNNTHVLSVSSKTQGNQRVLKLVGPQLNVNGQFNGDLESFSFNGDAVFNKEKYELMASTKNYFREISAKLTTPQLGEQSLSVTINGALGDCNGFIEFKNNNEIYRSEFLLNEHELHLTLPKWMKNLHVKLSGNWKNFEFIVQVMNYSGQRFEISATNKNFKEMKARLAIPGLDDIDIFIKTSGTLRNGGTTMKLSVGENIFENEVGINIDGSQASFEIKPHYEMFGRSGKANLEIHLMFESQSYKYEFEADVDGILIKSMASVKISSEISVLMTASIPTLHASEMKLRIVSTGFQKTDMMLNLKSPKTGMTKIFYGHNGQMGKSFSTKGYIEENGIRFAGYSLDTQFADGYSFDFSCDYENSKNKIETKGNLEFQGVKTVATLSVNTPFHLLREMFISIQTKMLRDGPSVQLEFNLPNQQYGLNFDLSNSNFNALLNMNIDKKNKDKQYQFQVSYKNNDQNTDVSRSLHFKMILPGRSVSLDSSFENAQSSMTVTGNLMWGESKDQNAGFELMVQKGSRREYKLRVIALGRTSELFGSVAVIENRYSAVGHIMMDESKPAQKVDIKADIMILSDRTDMDLTLKFPNQKKGMNMKMSINHPKDNIIFSSTSEFSMDQDPQKTIKMSTKLMSETKGKREMYTVQMDAKQKYTGFNAELIGRAASTPEKYNVEVEMGYLTLKRQHQKFAIRGEMHRLNRKVNLKLVTPSKTIELDGTLRAGNRYMGSLMKKENNKENMEALFKLNPNNKRMNIIFNYDEANPDNMYRIDAEIMKSKSFVKAYRTGKERDEDAAIYAELKPNNILKSGIKWNPHLLQEFNMFGYEKLTMYGKELKQFGDSLRQMLNDEVFVKLALVQRSFSEDMAPISDYFTTEYRILSKDFARTIQYMKQTFGQNYFSLRSALESVNNLWDDLWLNFDEYLIILNDVIEDFNGNLNNMTDEAKKQFDFHYGQYSMKIKAQIEGCFTHCFEQYNMWFERAMELKTEMVSWMKNYPEKIKDLVDIMRKDPYGEKVIGYLMAMYETINEKTTQASKHVETLTTAIYSAHSQINQHIASVRHYPIVDAIMEAINEVYQQALWSYNYWDVKDKVFGLKTTLSKFGAEKIKEIKNIITDVGMNTFVFDPKNGEIMVEIRIGATKYFYNHFMSSLEDVERAVMKLKHLMPTFNLNAWDIYYMAKPSTDMNDYIPPFKAEATLFAGQHITTFDGRHLNYKATCSYLLARDFVDGNFTVVANFDADSKAKTLKSLSVTTAHDEEVEIFSDNKVFFNGSAVELPLQLTDAEVRREGNAIIVESKRGYKVVCDHDIQLYTVQISGWYFNKIAGLFGNYNNEPKDDMLMSNSRYTNDLEQFAQSWSVSGQCQSHRNLAPSHMVPENRECANLFLETDSPFRYCFRQVNPDQFYKDCAMELSSSKAMSIDLCNITSFYRKKCEKKGVYLSTPEMCSKEM